MEAVLYAGVPEFVILKALDHRRERNDAACFIHAGMLFNTGLDKRILAYRGLLAVQLMIR